MHPISGWFCSTSSKNLFIKIVHPGGLVELHDRPMLAKDLLNRNPKCCVAYPNVFKQPYAVVSPETTLVLGQKYYVVPLGTIRKLQLKHPHSVLREKHREGNKDDDTDTSSSCWLFRNNKNDGREKNSFRNNKNDGREKNSGTKIKACNSESLSEEMRREDNGKRSVNEGSSSPGRLSLVSMDNWQPGLESIVEE
ncbi:hypothetical protein CDL12_08658 [Handroanthus impetiginosus]|uniref:DUF4228 domain-containing protein n=1 Tax=Handroanthus impetiginosus TaxID=429701 RepID=A0A2G9HMZ7_9LAMI|nr:hypothetical protein CDL12_08658 [Handroanthus impetiginosus]